LLKEGRSDALLSCERLPDTDAEAEAELLLLTACTEDDNVLDGVTESVPSTDIDSALVCVAAALTLRDDEVETVADLLQLTESGGDSVTEPDKLSDCVAAPVWLADCDDVTPPELLAETADVGIADRDCEALLEPLTEPKGDALSDCDSDALPDRETAGDVVETELPDCEELRVCAADAEAPGDADVEPLPEKLLTLDPEVLADFEGVVEVDRLGDADADPLAVTLPLPVAVAAIVDDGLRDSDTDGDDDGDCDPDGVAVATTDAPYDRDAEAVGGIDDEGVSDGVDEGLCEGDGSH
jgi:hypothetical protein